MSDQPTPGEVLNGDATEAYAHLKKRLNEPGAFRMDDEQRLHTLLSTLSPSEQPEPVAWARILPCGTVNHLTTTAWASYTPLYTQPSKQTGGGGDEGPWIKAGGCPDAPGELWLAANAQGKVFPGIFPGHRIPADAAFVQRLVMPDLADLSTNEVG